MATERPTRPWPYWYEVRMEYQGFFCKPRLKLWWRDMWLIPFYVWQEQRAERSLYEVISPDELRAALGITTKDSDG